MVCALNDDRAIFSLHSDHIPLISITAFGDIDALLVQRLAVDGPTGRQDLRAQRGRRIELNGTFADVGRRVHGRGVAARGEIDGRGCGQEWHDVDVVGDAGGIPGQRPGVVRVGVVGGDILDGLGTVEEEDVLLVCADGHVGLAGFERLDEDGRHFEEGAVVEIAVVGGRARFHQLREGGGVGGADVVRFAVVVPGDDFNVVGLQFQQVIPAVDVDVGVLRVEPVGVAGHALEEPGSYTGHPDFVVGGAGVAEGLVNGSFLRGGEGRMDPSEGARAAVGE